MSPSLDEQGNYIYPEGYDPETDSWLDGFEVQRATWERAYMQAHVRWRAERLSEQGLHEAAVSTAQEGIAINRRLAEDAPLVYLSVLADALSNLSHLLTEPAIGRYQEAVTALHEAIEIYRQLASADRSLLPTLTRLVDRISEQYAVLANGLGATEAAEEVVEIYRGLAGVDPFYLPHLATSLESLSQRLAGSGRLSSALQVTSEATRLRRRLETDPAA
jgi:tetratricopeptide (TPR) repeat protein